MEARVAGGGIPVEEGLTGVCPSLTMADMDKDTRLTFRMSQATREGLEHAAEAERRSVSDLAVIILENWLVAKGHLPAPGRPSRKGRK